MEPAPTQLSATFTVAILHSSRDANRIAATDTPWTWRSNSVHTMRTDAGDCTVQDDGKIWSVRDDLFRDT
ncbi:hypothetical protein A8144_03390 [Mycobacterium leprae 3125609]|nr:hypothetical protein A8144_03390 [Mycobacterium leprae 3125609]